LERIEIRKFKPDPVRQITKKQVEVIRLMCCGFMDKEIANELAISRTTVKNHRAEFYTSLNVRSPIELYRVAQIIGIVRINELDFYPKDFVLKPMPNKQLMERRVNL